MTNFGFQKVNGMGGGREGGGGGSGGRDGGWEGGICTIPL